MKQNTFFFPSRQKPRDFWLYLRNIKAVFLARKKKSDPRWELESTWNGSEIVMLLGHEEE